MLVKALNREGFWNYQTKGGLTIYDPSSTKRAPQYFWPHDSNNPATGHSWVVAPPFAIIDLSVKLKPRLTCPQCLPDYVMTETAESARSTVADVCSPEARAHYRAQRIPDERILAARLPHVEPFWQTFPPQVVRLGELALKYTATGIAAPEPGEPPGQWRCNGRSARELYEHVVVPELKEFRDRCTLADRV